MKRMITLCSTTIFALSSAHAQPGATTQDLAQLEARIAGFLSADTGQPGGLRAPLDQRLRLSLCPAAPELRMGPMQDHIIISCAPTGWRFTAPLAALPGTSVQATVGGVPIRNFAASPGAETPIIKKGDRITLIVPGEGFALHSSVTAEEDGTDGGTIRVRTAPKGPVLRARVISGDRVTLP